MKTTVEISDAILRAAKQRAATRRMTLRALIEEGLLAVLDAPPDQEPFALRDESVGGKGLHPDIHEGGWERIVELTYEGHGG